MRYIKFILPLYCLFFFSCKEEPIYIPPLGKNDPINTVRPHRVLVEEFTGVRCVNCPDGAAEIENLRSKYGENLVSVSIHAGDFAKKLSTSKYDFKIADGVSLLNFLGSPEGYPSAVINRKPFGTNNTLNVVGLAKWAGLIKEESKINPEADITAKVEFAGSSRVLKVTINIEPLVNMSDEHHLSVFLTESNIVDAQTVPLLGVKTDYVHKHVLRAALTNYDGQPITEKLSKGNVVSKTFNYTLPAEYKSKDCEIVAFIHKAGASKEVVQAVAAKVE
jgi:hypothetical protein